jgi:hypothetical protein
MAQPLKLLFFCVNVLVCKLLSPTMFFFLKKKNSILIENMISAVLPPLTTATVPGSPFRDISLIIETLPYCPDVIYNNIVICSEGSLFP